MTAARALIDEFPEPMSTSTGCIRSATADAPAPAWTLVLAAAIAIASASGCAAGRLPDARGLDVVVRAAPAALAADAGGARAIAAATGCEAEFVRVLATGAMVVRLWPTTRSSDVQQCLVRLKAMPGVQSAEPDAVLKTQ
jgi:hypothetical protein